jgi:predicted Zn-dependent peptidase
VNAAGAAHSGQDVREAVGMQRKSRRGSGFCGVVVAAGLAIGAGGAVAQQIAPEEFVLDNGMRFILLPRDEQPLNVAAGWLAQVGSVNERPGITGISHFLEHMMFKGSDVIGTSDAAKDREINEKLLDVRRRLHRAIYDVQYPRFLKGEIGFPWHASHDTPEIRELRGELTRLEDERKKVTINNDFDKIYTAEGASGMNAQTFYDWTRYFINVPSNKLELWAWLESDRIANPTLREFDAEKDVVVEERRQRLENAPTGELDEQFESMVWMASPYNWPVIGWPTDLQSYTYEETLDYFKTYYQPSNLIGVIVGDFDPAEAKQIVTSYFGRLKDYGTKPPPVRTMEIERLGQLRFSGECDCQPQAQVVFQGVAYGHADQAALEVVADLLNSRSGRLYKSLIEEQTIASSAQAYAWTLKYAGVFAVQAEVKGGATPEQLEEAIYAEIARLADEPVGAEELAKIKNQAKANTVRGMQNNMGLLMQILEAESAGSWEDINTYPDKIAAVTPEDIQRVVKEYLTPGKHAVALYTRKGGSEPVRLTLDDVLASVPEQARPMMRQQLESQLAEMAAATAEALPELKSSLEQARAQREMVPEQFRKMVDFAIQEMEAKIAELEAAGG